MPEKHLILYTETVVQTYQEQLLELVFSQLAIANIIIA